MVTSAHVRRAGSVLGSALVTVALLYGGYRLVKELTAQEKGGQPPCADVQPAQGRKRARVAAAPPGQQPAKEPIRLSPVAGGDPVKIAFREHREPRRARILFDASAPLRDDLKKLVAVPRGDFVRADGERFPLEQIVTRATVSTNGLHVTARLCLEPRGGRNVEPGTYKGTVLVEGRPRIQPASFSVEVSLRDPRTGFVFLWALFAAFAGVIVKLVVDVVKLLTPPPDDDGTAPAPAVAPAPVPAPNPGSPQRRPKLREEWGRLLNEALRLGNLLAILFGLVAGIAAYFLLYLDDDDFGSSADFFKLAVYCFGATVSGMTVADLGKRLPAGMLPARPGRQP